MAASTVELNSMEGSVSTTTMDLTYTMIRNIASIADPNSTEGSVSTTTTDPMFTAQTGAAASTADPNSTEDSVSTTTMALTSTDERESCAASQ